MITCPRITEQTGHVLETEIVAEVFPPVAEDDNDYSIVPSSALKMNIPAKFQMAIKLNLHILKIIFVCKLSHHLQILLMLIVFYTPFFRRDVLWYGAVRPSVRPSVRPTVSTKKHRCKWRIFFKFCTQVCLGVPSINLLFVLSYLIKYAHNSIISDFSILGIPRVIF